MLKQRTGLTPNLLCRIALMMSLEEGPLGNIPLPNEDGSEFNAYTLTLDSLSFSSFGNGAAFLCLRFGSSCPCRTSVLPACRSNLLRPMRCRPQNRPKPGREVVGMRDAQSAVHQSFSKVSCLLCHAGYSCNRLSVSWLVVTSRRMPLQPASPNALPSTKTGPKPGRDGVGYVPRIL